MTTREWVCERLTALGIDPNDVPLEGVRQEGDRVYVEVWPPRESWGNAIPPTTLRTFSLAEFSGSGGAQ